MSVAYVRAFDPNSTFRLLSVERTLQAMASSVFPERSLHPEVTFSKRVCHLFTAKAAAARKKNSDLIWLFGDKTSNKVTHSILTDSQRNVVMDSFAPYGIFQQDRGYHVDNRDNPDDTEGLHFEVLGTYTVGQWQLLTCD